ncbi:MAG TPA: DUF1501 domain-containing protein [Gemmatimonadaceae bacterium]|nr:DUF1501 domain-containing protein [Gemmatimonadaceae bacterium]
MTEQDEIECAGCAEYQQLSRRQFMSGAAAVAGAAAFPAWLPRVVLAKSYTSTRDVMVSVFQRGGADGLTLCVPFADPAYYASRPTIAIPRPDSSLATRGIALDDFFALPQGMAGLVPAYANGDLLFVHATGQLNNSRSHFDAQRYMEVGKPVDPALVTGWLGRHLASIPPLKPDAPLRALGVSAGLQKTLVGGPKTLPIADPANFNIGGTASTAAARLALLREDYLLADDPLKSSALDAVNTVSLLQSVGIGTYVPGNGAVYPNTAFGRALRSVAALIKADIGIEAAQVDIGNWDTHSAQDPIAGSMFNTMRDFSNALAAFHADVIAPAAAGVTLVSLSEFGRNVRENGSAGTDHGRATAILAMGKGINGGRVLTNGWPGLDRSVLENGQDLKVTLDYRDVLAEIVQNRLGNPNLSFVFPDWTPTFRGVTR